MSIYSVASGAALCFIWLLLITWTLVWLHAATQQPNSRIIRIGIAFGLGAWVWTTIVVSRYLVEAAAKSPKWQTILGIAFFMLPICLWAGYVWGRLMHAYMAGRRS